ncbi:hypothetical protein LTR36_009494 [Oleoguttula mirabilis]|uniref:AB hydrolase-1 domain-containing protein n=1 Tax=Oleoguttula mirabilis TaxID=1507867 RepID=A0AAV9JSX4_9PEZI|nr:hypothetical protein LTR36_009494 [Oleoguttula mirabilis]
MSSTNFECIQHTVRGSHIRQYPRALAHSQEDELQIAVKQYKPRHEPQPGDVTILACHANGFPKELYEPVWDALYDQSQKEDAGFRIRGIWIMDVANQGDSGVLNEGKLGNEPSWHDFARDYLGVVNEFRKEMPRPIVGFGHSMGGSVLLDMALLHPRLLTSLMLVEPIASSSQNGSWDGVAQILFRKDRWQSLDAAMKYFGKAPLHKRWDPQVFELYRQHGFRDVPEGVKPDIPEGAGVTLKTSRHQEALNYARAAFPESKDHSLDTILFDRYYHPEAIGVENEAGCPLYRPESTTLFKQLPSLRPSCLYLYGTESTFSAALAYRRKEKMEVTGTGTGGSGGAPEGRVKEMEFPGSHWSPFERPVELGQTFAAWLGEEMRRWRELEGKHSESWSAIPTEKRSAVNEDWPYWMRKLFVTPKPGAKQGVPAKL